MRFQQITPYFFEAIPPPMPTSIHGHFTLLDVCFDMIMDGDDFGYQNDNDRDSLPLPPPAKPPPKFHPGCIAWQWLPVSARMTACDQLDFQTSCQERGPGVLGGERAAATNAAAHAISRLTHGCQGSRCHSGPENTKTCSEISIPNSRCHLVFYACHCHQSTNRSGSSVSKLATSEA